jgi:hypothetical protein
VTVTSITVNQDLVNYEVLSEVEVDMLSTPESRLSVIGTPALPFPWRYRHERAWARVLRDLSLRKITEADLADTSELKYAACACVAAMAFQASETKEDQHRAEYWSNLYEREINEVKLTVTGGGSLEPAGYSTIKAYRC